MSNGSCSAPDVAIIVGGAESVDAEVGKAMALCSTHVRPVFFVTNDKIVSFGQVDHAVTLHPSKLPNWLFARAARKLPKPGAVWSFRLFDEFPQVTHASSHWQGSSGLFAVKIALETGFDKIILCGVPMTPEGGHYLRRQVWFTAEKLQGAWLKHKAELAPYVRSWSGWTKRIFMAPDAEWLFSETNISLAI